MKKFLVLFLSGLLLLGIIGGCSDENEEEAQIEELINDLSAFLSAADMIGEAITEDTIKEAIATVGWYREVENADFQWQYEFEWEGEDTANIDFYMDVSGTLHIFTEDSSEYTKAFADQFTRTAIVVKDTLETYHGGWRLAALSPVEVKSDGSSLVIDSVKVVWDDETFVMDDIHKEIDKSEVPVIPPSTEVTVTVYTSSPDNLLFLHSYQHRWFMPETEIGVSGIYERVFTSPDSIGIYRVGIDLLSRDTLLDDTAPYEDLGWIMPYFVE